MMIDDNLRVLLAMAGLAYLGNEALGALKRSPWFPRINEHTKTLNRAVAALFSLASTLGLVFACSGDASAGWTCTLAIPSADRLSEIVVRWGGQAFLSKSLFELGARK